MTEHVNSAANEIERVYREPAQGNDSDIPVYHVTHEQAEPRGRRKESPKHDLPELRRRYEEKSAKQAILKNVEDEIESPLHYTEQEGGIPLDIQKENEE